jgi:hypothetical protein
MLFSDRQAIVFTQVIAYYKHRRKKTGGYLVDSTPKNGKTITYHVGRKHGQIQSGNQAGHEGKGESAWISTVGRGWLHSVWKPMPFMSSRALYVLFWLLPLFAFGMTWLLAYLLVR